MPICPVLKKRNTKSNVMKEFKEAEYVKRTEKNYSYAFKIGVIEEVEIGDLGIKAA